MRKQMLTGLAVLILGSSVAFASPQSYRNNFNDQPARQTRQQAQWNQRTNQQPPTYQRASQRNEQQSNQQQSNQRQRNQRHRKNIRRSHRSNW